MQPLRAIVASLTEHPHDQNGELREVTIRQAIEWTKRIVREGPPVPTGAETAHMNAVFMEIAEAISKREGIPLAYAAGLIHEIAMTEIQLLETAQAEKEMNSE